MQDVQQAVANDRENHDAQRQNVRLAEPVPDADADKYRGREQLQHRVQAAQTGNHRRIILQHENDEIGENGSKQPFCPEATQIHAQMLTEHTQVECRFHVANQRQHGFAEGHFLLIDRRGFFYRAFPGREIQHAQGDKQDHAIRQCGVEKRLRGVFAVDQNELARNERGEEVRYFAENRFIAGQF
ncbi:hypothetical protein SRABI106_02735 [Rahnella aquatilis]|nr:hypothetical protein SRABI106_02735 [Rahnella aquatilis]